MHDEVTRHKHLNLSLNLIIKHFFSTYFSCKKIKTTFWVAIVM
jgi:hypothetical protein